MQALALSGKQSLRVLLWLHRALGVGHRAAFGASDEVHWALGGVGRFRFLLLLAETGDGGPRRRHRSSELFPAFWRPLPGEKCAEVRRAFAAMLCTGVSEGAQPMLRI